MQIAVCDDDKICCGQIERWINNYKKRENIDINVEIFYNGEKVLDEIKKNC